MKPSRNRVAARLLAALTSLTAMTACTSSGKGAHADSSTAGGNPSAGAHSTPVGSSATGTPASSATTAMAAVSDTGAPNGAPPSSAAKPVAPKALRTTTVQGSFATYVIKIWASDTTTSCTSRAYGAPVIAFLKKHPCTELARTLGTTTVAKRQVGLAQSRITFSGSAVRASSTAAAFAALLTKGGAGDFVDLLRAGNRLPSGPASLPNPHTFSARSSATSVAIVDGWYLSGRTPKDDPELVMLAENIGG